MDYNDGIRAARTDCFWRVQNRKPTSPVSDPLIVLLYFLPLITSLQCSSSPTLSLPYLTPPIPYRFPCNCTLFFTIPHFSFLFFPQTPHFNLVLFPSLMSVHLHLSHPFNLFIPTKYHREDTPQEQAKGLWGKWIVNHQWPSRDARNGHLLLIGRLEGKFSSMITEPKSGKQKRQWLCKLMLGEEIRPSINFHQIR